MLSLAAPQISDPDEIDAIFVPVGGGGLIAGIAAFIKALKPNIKVRSHQAEGTGRASLLKPNGNRACGFISGIVALMEALKLIIKEVVLPGRKVRACGILQAGGMKGV